MESFEIDSTIQGPLRVVIVDSTSDRDSFEHYTSRLIAESMRVAGVDVAGPFFVDSVVELTNRVNGEEFSALLWVAHGGAATHDHVAEVVIGSDHVPWQLIANSSLNLGEKLVALCICSAANEDMIVSLHQSQVFALVTVAPTKALHPDEAKKFFPAFFAKISPTSVATIDPLWISEAVDELNHLAHGKMETTIL